MRMALANGGWYRAAARGHATLRKRKVRICRPIAIDRSITLDIDLPNNVA